MVKVELCFDEQSRCQASSMESALAERSIRTVPAGTSGVSAIVLLLSRESGLGEELLSRVEIALASGIRIYPVLLGSFRPSERLHFLISNLQWFDASSGNLDEAAGKIAEGLLMNPRKEDGAFLLTFKPCRVECPGNFVGRRSELLRLKGALKQAEASSGPLILGIRGEAGVGKSSLAGRFLTSVCRGATCFNAVTAEPEDSSVDFILWARLVSSFSRESCFTADPALASQARYLLPMSLSSSMPAPSDPAKLEKRVASFIAGLLRISFREGKRILFIDNLHWADSGSLMMLVDVLAELGSLPLLVLMAYRPAMPGGTPVSVPVPENCTPAGEISLQPLSYHESEELLGLLLNSDPSRDRRIGKLARSAEGWPLHLELLARQGEEPLEGEDTGMRRLVHEAFERLPEGRRTLLNALCVLGGDSMVETVMETAGVPLEFEDIILQNDEFALLEETSLSRRLHFRQDTLREAVYLSLKPEERRETHLRAALVLERRYRGDSRFSGEICTHWEKAGMLEKALEYAARYLEHMNSIYHSQAVITWAERAEGFIMRLGLTERRAEQLALFLQMEEEALGRMGLLQRREEILDRLEEIAVRYDLPERLVSCFCSRGFMRKDQGRYHQAAELFQRALEFSEGRNDSYRAACAAAGMAAALSDHVDKLEQAEELYLRALKVFIDLDEKKDMGTTYMHLGILHLDSGDKEKALDYTTRSLELFRDTGYLYGESMALINLANVYSKMRLTGDAVVMMEKAAVVMRKAGDLHNLAIVLGNRANEISRLGRLTEALEGYREAVELNLRNGNRKSEEKARANYADCLRKLGRFDESLDQLKKAEEINANTGNTHWLGRILEGRGRTLMEKGLYPRARAALEKALEIAVEKDYGYRNRIYCTMAATELKDGRPGEALELCRKVIEGHDGSFSVSAAEALIIEADAKTAEGLHREALQIACGVSELVRDTESVLVSASAIACRGRALVASGRTEEGRQMLARAAAIADRCGYGDLFWFSGTEEFRKRP